MNVITIQNAPGDWRIGAEHLINDVPHIVIERHRGQGDLVRLVPRDEWLLHGLVNPFTVVKIGETEICPGVGMSAADLLVLIRQVLLAELCPSETKTASA